MAVNIKSASEEFPLLERSFEMQRDTFSKEKRTIRVQFASESPVERWFGTEILRCSADSVDLSRVNSGAAVLMEHDPKMRCGITERGNITTNGTAEAEIRLARNAAGDACMAEIEDGTLRWISVGYKVDKFDVNEDTEEYVATRWTPLEVSFVSIPADPTAKVLRSTPNEKQVTMFTRSRLLAPDITPGGSAAPAAPAIVPSGPDFSRMIDEAREILSLGMYWQRTHPTVVELVDKSLRDKVGIVDFQRALMNLIKTTAPAPSVAGVEQAGDRSRNKPIGTRFVESKQYKENMARRNFKGWSMEIPDEFTFNTRATFSAGTEGISGTSGVNIQQISNFNVLGQQTLQVADLFSSGTTTSDVVRFIRESTYTQAATRVAEGAAKPAATLDLGVQNVTVEKTAVHQDVTEEMLSDWAQASSFINQRLAYMVQSLEDVQLLSGSGSSQIYGILNTTGIQTLSGAANTIDKLLTAKTYVEGAAGAGFAAPDAYVMHPLDWLNIRLSKDSNGQYVLGGPGYAPYGVGGYANISSIWGIPVLTTTSQAQGTALVGAFKMGAQIFRRQGLTIRTTDSDGSKFLSNILTVVAEQRMALAVWQPNKFCAITAIPA